VIDVQLWQVHAEPCLPARVREVAVIVATRKGDMADEPEATVDVGQAQSGLDQLVNSGAAEALRSQQHLSSVFGALAYDVRNG
jgi:hypothetical protein